jgi:hypothetical protein
MVDRQAGFMSSMNNNRSASNASNDSTSSASDRLAASLQEAAISFSKEMMKGVEKFNQENMRFNNQQNYIDSRRDIRQDTKLNNMSLKNEKKVEKLDRKYRDLNRKDDKLNRWRDRNEELQWREDDRSEDEDFREDSQKDWTRYYKDERKVATKYNNKAWDMIIAAVAGAGIGGYSSSTRDIVNEQADSYVEFSRSVENKLGKVQGKAVVDVVEASMDGWVQKFKDAGVPFASAHVDRQKFMEDVAQIVEIGITDPKMIKTLTDASFTAYKFLGVETDGEQFSILANAITATGVDASFFETLWGRIAEYTVHGFRVNTQEVSDGIYKHMDEWTSISKGNSDLLQKFTQGYADYMAATGGQEFQSVGEEFFSAGTISRSMSDWKDSNEDLFVMLSKATSDNGTSMESVFNKLKAGDMPGATRDIASALNKVQDSMNPEQFRTYLKNFNLDDETITKLSVTDYGAILTNLDKIAGLDKSGELKTDLATWIKEGHDQMSMKDMITQSIKNNKLVSSVLDFLDDMNMSLTDLVAVGLALKTMFGPILKAGIKGWSSFKGAFEELKVSFAKVPEIRVEIPKIETPKMEGGMKLLEAPKGEVPKMVEGANPKQLRLPAPKDYIINGGVGGGGEIVGPKIDGGAGLKPAGEGPLRMNLQMFAENKKVSVGTDGAFNIKANISTVTEGAGKVGTAAGDVSGAGKVVEEVGATEKSGVFSKIFGKTGKLGQVLEGMGPAGKILNTVGRVVGKVAIPLGLAASGLSIATADDKKRETVKQVGGWGGAFAGGAVGAQVGALAGSALGPVGTAVGGIVGSIGGGVAGMIGGEKATAGLYDSRDKITSFITGKDKNNKDGGPDGKDMVNPNSLPGMAQGFNNYMDGINKSMGEWFNGIGNNIGYFFTKTMPDKWNEVIGGIGTWIGNTGKTIGDFFTVTIPNKWNEIVTSIGVLFASIGKTIGDKWNEIIGGVGTLGKAIGDFFTVTIPAKWNETVSNVGSWFVGVGKSIGDFFTITIPAKWNETVASVGEWFSSVGSAVGTFFTQTLPNYFMVDLPQNIGYAVGLFAGTLVNFFTVTLPTTWNNLVTTVGDWVLATADNIMNFFTVTLPTTWNNLVATVGDWVLATANNLWTFFTVTLPTTLNNAFAAVWDWVNVLATNIWTFFTITLPTTLNNAFAAIWDWVNVLATNIWTFFTVTLPTTLNNAFAPIWDWIQVTATNIWTFFTVTLPTTFLNAMSGLWDWIQATANGVWNFFTVTVPGAFNSAVSGVWGWVSSVGNAISTFFTSTVPSAINGAVSGVGGWIETAISAVKTFFTSAIPNAMASIKSGALSWLTNLFNGGKAGYEAGKSKRVGMRSVPYDGYKVNMHRGEPVLNRDDASDWRAQKNGEKQVFGSHREGLNYVPFDGYYAEVHAGEAILTRDQAKRWRAENGTAPKDPNSIFAGNDTGSGYVGSFSTGSDWTTGDTDIHAWFLDRLGEMAKKWGSKLNISSGYRSVAEQQAIWDATPVANRGVTVAKPGNSRHQAGLAADVTGWGKGATASQLASYGLWKPMSYEDWHIEPVETKDGSGGTISTADLIKKFGYPWAESKVPNVTSGSDILSAFEGYNLDSPLRGNNSGVTADDLDKWINAKTGSNSDFRGKGSVFYDAANRNSLDPVYLLAHAAHESAWGTSNIGKSKNNYYGIGAFDSSPYKSAYSWNGIDAGIEAGADWITKNYIAKGQNTLRKMRHNNGVHEYATDPSWDEKILSIMQGNKFRSGTAESNVTALSDSIEEPVILPVYDAALDSFQFNSGMNNPDANFEQDRLAESIVNNVVDNINSLSNGDAPETISSSNKDVVDAIVWLSKQLERTFSSSQPGSTTYNDNRSAAAGKTNSVQMSELTKKLLGY